MAGPVGVDMELKKAFQELQAKMMITTEKLKMADLHIDSLKRIIQHAQLTEKEISSLPPGTRMYESMGRMFVGTSSTDVKQSLDKKIKTSQEKIKQNEKMMYKALEELDIDAKIDRRKINILQQDGCPLGTNKAYLEKDMKESEDNLREMIAHKQKGR